MLVTNPADTATVINRLLVLTAFVCCGLVLASFALFSRDQIAGASKHQQNELVSGTPGTPTPVPAQHKVAQPRRFIDGAWRVLTTPFRSIVQSDSQWVLHGLPTILALLLYGLGLGYLARYSRGFS
jgi:hypothetical protein